MYKLAQSILVVVSSNQLQSYTTIYYRKMFNNVLSLPIYIIDKYSVKDISFRWKRDNPITFPKDFDEGFFRLPKYVVSFSTVREPQILHFNDVDHCSARLGITLSREVKSYLLENYLPSTLFVSMSWGSFIVVPEIVPGRMVRLILKIESFTHRQLMFPVNDLSLGWEIWISRIIVFMNKKI